MNVHEVLIFQGLEETWQLSNLLLKSMFDRCAMDPDLVTQVVAKAVSALHSMACYSCASSFIKDAFGGENVVAKKWGFVERPKVLYFEANLILCVCFECI